VRDFLPAAAMARLKSAYGGSNVMMFLLWILAVILVVAGIVSLIRGQMLWGIVLIIVGLAVGPGGYSIFS
jgi:uncharacterized membrane protein YdbT with pleckstrin-like domain